MKSLISTLRNIWKIEDLRQRILTTLGFVLIYRLGSFVTLPGIDPNQLQMLESQTSDGLLGLLNLFTGGAFSQASIMALGIMPYISASIVIQLLGVAVPYIQKLQREGESGRTKINQLTRYLTILITGVQGPGYIANLQATLPETAFLLSPSTFWTSSIIILVTGTLFAMWLGEKNYRQRYRKWYIPFNYDWNYCCIASVICIRVCHKNQQLRWRSCDACH